VLLAFVTMVATQGMTGGASSVALLLGYTIIWFVLFGFAGGVPYISTDALESALKALVAFGTGGAVAGALVVCLLVTPRLGGSPTAVKLEIPLTPHPFGRSSSLNAG
jgi:hypothetical protein